MAAPNDSPLFVRLTADEKERLRKVARATLKSASMNEYAVRALLAAIERDEVTHAPLLALQAAAEDQESRGQ